jgi:hypothetical protein
MMPGVWRCSLLEAPGRPWPHVFRDWSPRLFRRGDTWRDSVHPKLGHSGFKPSRSTCRFGDGAGPARGPSRVLGKPYIDLMTFGVWGSIEDACRG